MTVPSLPPARKPGKVYGLDPSRKPNGVEREAIDNADPLWAGGALVEANMAYRAAGRVSREVLGPERGTSSPAYRSAFQALLARPNRLTETEVRVLEDGSRLERRDQGVATGAAGGYLVPNAWVPVLTAALKWSSAMVSTSRIIETPTGATLNQPILDDTSVVADLLPENQSEGMQDAVLTNVSLGSFLYSVGDVRISWQLLNDAEASGLAIDDFIAIVGQRLGRLLEQHFTTGTGSGQPTGILASPPASATVSEATGNTNSITYAGLTSLAGSLNAAYRPNAVWMLHSSTLEAVSQLVDGNRRPVTLYPGNQPYGAEPTLLGSKVVINDSMTPFSSLSAGAVSAMYGDFSRGYFIRHVEGDTVRLLGERRAEQLQSELVMASRYDGAPGVPGAVVFLKTSAS